MKKLFAKVPTQVWLIVISLFVAGVTLAVVFFSPATSEIWKLLEDNRFRAEVLMNLIFAIMFVLELILMFLCGGVLHMMLPQIKGTLSYGGAEWIVGLTGVLAAMVGSFILTSIFTGDPLAWRVSASCSMTVFAAGYLLMRPSPANS